MIRQLFVILLSLLIALGQLPSITQAATNATSVYLDGKKLSFDVPPSVIKGRTLVPLRTIFEELGATVQWDGKTKTVTAIKGATHISLTVGKSAATKNKQSLSLDVPATMVQNRTLVPLRFVSEAMGATVWWEGNTRTIVISSCTKKQVKVERVVDGDTVEVNWDEKTEKIRLIGVNTPESQRRLKNMEKKLLPLLKNNSQVKKFSSA